MKEKDFMKWTINEFKSLPEKKWQEDIGLIDSIIILPTKKLHESGFKCMDFIAIQNGIPTYRLSGCSDVIHIGGIGGYNNNYKLRTVEAVGWSIDCLPVSGLLRLFCERKLTVGEALSSMEVFYSETK